MKKSASDVGTITRRELFDRIWSRPMTTNAIALKTTAPALASLARSLALPLPRAGHWMKKEVGKEPPTPDYPADAQMDGKVHAVPVPKARLIVRRTMEDRQNATSCNSPAALPPDDQAGLTARAQGEILTQDEPSPINEPASHKMVASTRAAILKSRSNERIATGGRGKFRLLVSSPSGERACAILDRLVAAVEAQGWSVGSTDLGYAILADGETVGLMIEEKLDRIPHVITPAEIREKADYERKCALAARGIGYRPWREPTVPEHDFLPNGELVLKFDREYDAGGARRTYSDGKRQQLEDLVPMMIDALEGWAASVKQRRAERDEQKLKWEEQDRRRKDLERQARVEGYRISFLGRQVERKREIEGLAALIEFWSKSDGHAPEFDQLLEFAGLYRRWLEEKLSPGSVTTRIRELKLMNDDVYIWDAKRLD